MAKKKTDDQDQIPLSETQNTALTGREDITDTDDGDIEDPFWAERSFRIKDAVLKDGFCNYGYEIIRGIGIGDTHNVKGSALFERDLAEAFSKLNVHLAVIDDAFKAKDIKLTDINLEHGHELTGLYSVTGIKIKGGDESESVILIGDKYISSGGRLDLETPKIALDNFSSYKWREDLAEAVNVVRKEVALYKEGKCTPVEQEEEKPKLKQTNLFGLGSDVKVTVSSSKGSEELDEDFAEAAL